MDGVVSADVRNELMQILANLVLGDNQVRAQAEQAVDDRLARSPETYLLALAQYASDADTEVMRSFSLVLLRRLLLRPTPPTPGAGSHGAPATGAPACLYDGLPGPALLALERALLHSLAHEPAPAVRAKALDTAVDLAEQGMARGRPWHALQVHAFGAVTAPAPAAREGAFRIFAGCPAVMLDLQPTAIAELLQKGLQDPESVEVRLAAVRASVAYLSGCDTHQRAQAVGLLHPLLETLPTLPPVQLARFLRALHPLAQTHAELFAPHARALLAFLAALLLSPAEADPGPTPTVGRPFPGGGGSAFSFDFPPAGAPVGKGKAPARGADDEAREDARRAALELLLVLSEERPAAARRVDGWAAALVRGCLEGMGELDDEELDAWLSADPDDDPTRDAYPETYEHALDRLGVALGGAAVLQPAFQYIPAMLASPDWRHRHAGLMAISVLAEGTTQVMKNELDKIVALVLPAFQDAHPRVRYAACQCVGILCSDVGEIVQERYHAQLFGALIPALEAPEARVHAHAASALINVCEGVERAMLAPYLDALVERLLALLRSPPAGGAHYVQEQAVTTLAVVADASEATFVKHYSSIMPLLLDALENANGLEYRKLRQKSMECAGLIAIAVGKDVFRSDATRFVDLLMRIQNSPLDPDDTLLPSYLIATWAKVCQAMGAEFELYLPIVMPPLLQAAAAKTELSVYDEDVDEDRDGWETLTLDGRQVGIRTAQLEEKCQALETLVVHCSTLGPRFAPYLMPTLELTLPMLRFHFHEGVQEAACMLVPLLIGCGMKSSTLTSQMAHATFRQLVACIGSEADSALAASLLRCFADCTRAVGGPSALPADAGPALEDAAKRQLHALAEKRRRRGARAPRDADEREDLGLLEEFEDIALDEMEKTLRYLNAGHPLLVAISSVRELGLGLGDEDEEGA